MKNKAILTGFLFIVLIFWSCISKDPIYYTSYKFINNSEQNMNVLMYNNGIIRSSFCLSQAEDTTYAYSKMGNKIFPFKNRDSVHIYYNDTTLFAVRNNEADDNVFESFLLRENWGLVEQKGNAYYYEYVFTEEYYQQALENGQ